MTIPASLTGAAHVRTNDARGTATVTVAARAWLVRRPGAPDRPPSRFETGPYRSILRDAGWCNAGELVERVSDIGLWWTEGKSTM